MIAFKVQKNSYDEFSYTNKIFFNPSDWALFKEKFITVTTASNKFIFKSDKDESVKKGCMTTNGIQRKWMYCGIGEVVQCIPYSFQTVVLVTEVIVELDLFVKSASLKDPIDSDKLAVKYLERFHDTPVTKNQLLLFNWESINFEAKIISIQGLDVKSSKMNEIETGIIQSNTVFKFQRRPESKFMLSGRCKAENAAVCLINPNWDFNSIGVGGLDEEFSQIFKSAFLSRLFPPEFVEELGIKHVRGILLYGPPGTGKTLTARQIGKMLNAREPKIVNGPSILDKYVGESEANIRKLFADAEEEFKKMGNQSALHIIIFDEIDAICKARGNLSGGSAVQDTVVNQLLAKMDGVEQLNNILIIGMTNRRDMIDEALLRPGRMGVQIEVPLPSQHGRLQIFEIHTKKLREKNILADDIDLKELAALTKNYSGAEIEAVVMAALANAQDEKFDPKKGIAIRIEDLQSFKINRQHFIFAIDHDVKALYGRHDDDLQEFKENRLLKWSPQISKALSTAGLLIESLKTNDNISRKRLLIYGEPLTGTSSVAVHLAKETGFTFIRMCSMRNMIGFSEPARCLAIKKIFDDALKAPASVIILDDVERLIDYSSIGPRFSIFLVNNLIGMINCFVPKNKKMLIIGTTKHLSAMHELEFFSAFDKNCIKIPEIKTPSEIISVLADQDLYSDSDLQQIDNHLQMGDCSDLAIGIKNLMENCKDLKSVDPARRVDELLMKLKSSSEFQF